MESTNNGSFHPDICGDDILTMVGNTSKYCDLNSINNDENIHCFKNAMYCALHLNIPVKLMTCNTFCAL